MVTARQRERLSAIRARGRKAFIWRQGVLGYGLWFAVSMAAIMPWLSGYDRPFPRHPLLRFVALIFFYLPFGVVGGLWWGRWMWRYYESKNWFAPPGDKPHDR